MNHELREKRKFWHEKSTIPVKFNVTWLCIQFLIDCNQSLIVVQGSLHKFSQNNIPINIVQFYIGIVEYNTHVYIVVSILEQNSMLGTLQRFYFILGTFEKTLRQVSGINYLNKMSTYHLVCGDSEITVLFSRWLIIEYNHSIHKLYIIIYILCEVSPEVDRKWQ